MTLGKKLCISLFVLSLACAAPRAGQAQAASWFSDWPKGVAPPKPQAPRAGPGQ